MLPSRSVNRLTSMTKSLSFTSKSRPNRNHDLDEENIFCSDIVSKDFIAEKLKEVKKDPRIVKVEIEDLLVARVHHSFLPAVKNLLLSEKHEWKYLRFIDSIREEDYSWWEGMKFLVMREYETTIVDHSKFVSQVTFQANVEAASGTNRDALVCLLKTILKDHDLQEISFAGSLFGVSNEKIPESLDGLFDEADCLTDRLMVNVQCGWSKKSRPEAREFIKSCVQGLLSPAPREAAEDAEADTDPLAANSNHSIRSARSIRSSISEGAATRSRPRRSSSNQDPIPMQKQVVRKLPPRNRSYQVKRTSSSDLSQMLPRSRATPQRTKSSDLSQMVPRTRATLQRTGSMKSVRRASRASESSLAEAGDDQQRRMPQRNASFRVHRRTPSASEGSLHGDDDATSIRTSRTEKGSDSAPRMPGRSHRRTPSYQEPEGSHIDDEGSAGQESVRVDLQGMRIHIQRGGSNRSISSQSTAASRRSHNTLGNSSIRTRSLHMIRPLPHASQTSLTSPSKEKSLRRVKSSDESDVTAKTYPVPNFDWSMKDCSEHSRVATNAA